MHGDGVNGVGRYMAAIQRALLINDYTGAGDKYGVARLFPAAADDAALSRRLPLYFDAAYHLAIYRITRYAYAMPRDAMR